MIGYKKIIYKKRFSNPFFLLSGLGSPKWRHIQTSKLYSQIEAPHYNDEYFKRLF